MQLVIPSRRRGTCFSPAPSLLPPLPPPPPRSLSSRAAGEGPAFRPHHHYCLPFHHHRPAACHPEPQARDLLFARTITTAFPSTTTPRSLSSRAAGEGPAFRPHHHYCLPFHHHRPAACHPEPQARDLLFARTITTASPSTTTAPQLVIPSRRRGTCFSPAPSLLPPLPPPPPRSLSSRAAGEGPAFRPHHHYCLPFHHHRPAACHPEPQARDLLFARTITTASPSTTTAPQLVIPSRRRGTCFSPAPRRSSGPTTTVVIPSRRRGTCLSPAPSLLPPLPPPRPAACHPEPQTRDLLFARTITTASPSTTTAPQLVIPSRRRGTCFSPAPRRSSGPTTTVVIPSRRRGTCFSPAPQRSSGPTTTVVIPSRRRGTSIITTLFTPAATNAYKRR